MAPGVRSGVDGHQRVHARGVLGLGRRRRLRHHRADIGWPPQSALPVDSTWPASVVTAPPAAFWNGSGMSTFCWLGHSQGGAGHDRDADGHQHADDDLGGQRAQAGTAVAG